jgi:hypothetical protein
MFELPLIGHAVPVGIDEFGFAGVRRFFGAAGKGGGEKDEEAG